jgi:hypothetical protein
MARERSFIIGFAASAMAPPASRAQAVEQFTAVKNEPPSPAASRAPMSRIIDSQAQAWAKISNNWRHHAPDEPRAPLSPVRPCVPAPSWCVRGGRYRWQSQNRDGSAVMVFKP